MRKKKYNMLFQIFPTLIYKENLSISPININKIEFSPLGNFKYSTSDNILEEKYFSSLKKEIQRHVDIFTKDILEIENTLNFFITRSWVLSIDKINDSGPFHSHGNSFFTGVFYINVDEEKDSFQIERSKTYQYIHYNYYENPNEWNQQLITYYPKKNDLIIFDASLSHRIGHHLTSKLRTVIAFEVFAKGTFGSKSSLNSYNKGKLTL
jgi:uncharacterized protein (TIGR02466 family)